MTFHQNFNYLIQKGLDDGSVVYDDVRIICGGLGMEATNAGPYVYFIDTCALANPLLSKIPFNSLPGNWRIGHFNREIPSGYKQTLETGINLIEDKNLHEYYKVIEVITRGDLWDLERFKKIINFNLGKYEYLLEEYKAK